MSVPKLRFKDENGQDFPDWEESTIGDIITQKSEKFNPEKSEENFKCIELEHLSQETGELLGYTDGQKQKSIKNKFRKGDVLFGKLRPYLKKFLKAPFDGVCSSEIWVLTGKKVSNDFVHLFIQTENFITVVNISSGSKMPRADWGVVSDGLAQYPVKEEQTKIADFLMAVDEKIAQLTQKCELLARYKKGVMQQIFSQELRFKDDYGSDFPDWEDTTLGDIATFLKGKGISKADIVKDGDTLCIRYGELYTEYSETIQEIKSKTNINHNELQFSKSNDVIIPASGETQIDIAKASCILLSGVALGGDLNIIRSKENGVFLAYYLNTRKKLDIAKLAQGNSVVHLYASQLKLLDLTIPIKAEQAKIANFLTSIDEKITEAQTYLDTVKQYKQGLLQQMFV